MAAYPKIQRGADLKRKRKLVEVDLPEIESTFTLRALSIGQVREAAETMMDQLAISIIDDNGERVFENSEELLELPLGAVNRLIEAFKQINGSDQQSIESVKKNSELDTMSVSA